MTTPLLKYEINIQVAKAEVSAPEPLETRQEPLQKDAKVMLET